MKLAEKILSSYKYNNNYLLWEEHFSKESYQEEIAQLLSEIENSQVSKILVVSNRDSYLVQSLSALYWFKNHFLLRCKNQKNIKIGWVVQDDPIKYYVIKGYLSGDSIRVYKNLQEVEKFF